MKVLTKRFVQFHALHDCTVSYHYVSLHLIVLSKAVLRFLNDTLPHSFQAPHAVLVKLQRVSGNTVIAGTKTEKDRKCGDEIWLVGEGGEGCARGM